MGSSLGRVEGLKVGPNVGLSVGRAEGLYEGCGVREGGEGGSVTEFGAGVVKVEMSLL